MALQITGTIELDNGLSLSSCYGRTNAELTQDGSSVICFSKFWNSKEAYNQGLNRISPVFGNSLSISVPYNRTTDGVDVLLFSNEQIKTQLEGLGFSVEIIDL